MSEADPARDGDRRRSLGHVQKTKNPGKMRPKSDGGVDHFDVDATHQTNGVENHRTQTTGTGNNQCDNADSSAVMNHVENTCVVFGGATNGEMPNGSGEVNTEKGGRRKRRSKSEDSDGSPHSKNLLERDVGFMWTQANGHSGTAAEMSESERAVESTDSSPLSPDVFYSPMEEEASSAAPTDDMNGYMNANAHLLAFLEMNGEPPSASDGENLNFLPGNHHGRHLSSNSNDARATLDDESQSDKIDEGIALVAELEYFPLPSTTKLSTTSSEDQGDFIETDISLQQLGGYASSSRGSSCSDLPNLVQRAGDVAPPEPTAAQQHHNNNVSKDAPGYSSEKIRNACESCDRNHHATGDRGAVETFSLTSQGRNSYDFRSVRSAGVSCSEACSLLFPVSQSKDSRNYETTFAGAGTSATLQNSLSGPVASTSGVASGPSGAAAPPGSRHHSSTARSSSSSFLSPDMDGEFMDLDFDPGALNSDAEQSIPTSDSAQDFSHDWSLWSAAGSRSDKAAPQPGSFSHGDRFGCNAGRDHVADHVGNTCCRDCDRLSDTRTHHQASASSSCCRPKRVLLQSKRESPDGQVQQKGCSCGDEPFSKCNKCDEGCADMDMDTRSRGQDSGDGAGGVDSTPNNLDMACSDRHDDCSCAGRHRARHYNVTHQTSTSNYNQDENRFQGDDAQDVSNVTRMEQEMENNFARAHNKSDGLFRMKTLFDQQRRQQQAARAFPDGGDGDDNEADDEGEGTPPPVPASRPRREGEGTPPPIPGPRPPLNRRLELLEEHNLNLQQQNLQLLRFPTSSVNSENQVLAGAVGGPDFRPGATNFSDDESPSRAVSLLEHQFSPPGVLAFQLQSSRRVPAVRPRWMSPTTEDLSPLGALGLLEHELRAQTGTGNSGPAHAREGESPPVWELSHVTDMDSLADMFLVGLTSSKAAPSVPGRPRVLVERGSGDGAESAGGGGAGRETPPGGARERVMIWSDYEAYVLQVTQIGVSACGATAVINVLKAFDLKPDKTAVCKAVKTNLRAEMSSVPEYLLSRSVAGTTAQHLIDGVDELTSGAIVGRFFHFWPPRDVALSAWLAGWMKKGAVPVVTLNLQKDVPYDPDKEIPDAWHHQMVYGVGPKGIYVTNPLAVVPEATVRAQLTSDSVLLVRRRDIILRWTSSPNLGALLQHPDTRWRTMNVVGQVVNVLREANRPRVPGFRPQQTSHVRIPAFYRAGVTLFVRRDSDAQRELQDAPELPLECDKPVDATATRVSKCDPSSGKCGKSSSRLKAKGSSGRKRRENSAAVPESAMDTSDGASASTTAREEGEAREPVASTSNGNQS